MVSEMMRNWVAGRLNWISEVMGIRLAAPLAYVMTRRQDIITWNSESDNVTDNVVAESSTGMLELGADNLGPDSPIMAS